ncbi:MAG: hypothetical protein MJZ67_05745 [Bacteroidales bacterium]|nr:hypothetical protein [Bacteroidales bacterium]
MSFYIKRATPLGNQEEASCNQTHRAGAKRYDAPRAIGEIIAQMKAEQVEPFGHEYHKWQTLRQKGGAA